MKNKTEKINFKIVFCVYGEDGDILLVDIKDDRGVKYTGYLSKKTGC